LKGRLRERQEARQVNAHAAKEPPAAIVAEEERAFASVQKAAAANLFGAALSHRENVWVCACKNKKKASKQKSSDAFIAF